MRHMAMRAVIWLFGFPRVKGSVRFVFATSSQAISHASTRQLADLRATIQTGAAPWWVGLGLPIASFVAARTDPRCAVPAVNAGR